jgi:hypothetical protein
MTATPRLRQKAQRNSRRSFSQLHTPWRKNDRLSEGQAAVSRDNPISFFIKRAKRARNEKSIRWLSGTHRSESAIMKKTIILTLTFVWLVAPALAGSSGAKDTTVSPAAHQNGASAAQDAKAPGSAADKQDDKNKGLSRNSDDCNKGCIGGTRLERNRTKHVASARASVS